MSVAQREESRNNSSITHTHVGMNKKKKMNGEEYGKAMQKTYSRMHRENRIEHQRRQEEESPGYRHRVCLLSGRKCSGYVHSRRAEGSWWGLLGEWGRGSWYRIW